MARTTIARTAVTVTGFNLTDATFTTMSTGAGNGIEVPARQGDTLVLYNSTGGAAVYTLKLPTPTAIAARGATVPDVTYSVATGKMHLYPLTDTIFRQSDGDVYVDCDVAGKIVCLATGT